MNIPSSVELGFPTESQMGNGVGELVVSPGITLYKAFFIYCKNAVIYQIYILCCINLMYQK